MEWHREMKFKIQHRGHNSMYSVNMRELDNTEIWISVVSHFYPAAPSLKVVQVCWLLSDLCAPAAAVNGICVAPLCMFASYMHGVSWGVKHGDIVFQNVKMESWC